MMQIKKIENKKALSELVAYVILISITITISVIVFAWVKCYVPGSCSKESEKCPDDLALVIKDYHCSTQGEFTVNITIQNKGLFTVDGFLVKANDRDSKVGVYTLVDSQGNKYGQALGPSEEITKSFSLSASTIEGNPEPLCGNAICSLRLIQVQPFMIKTGSTEKIFCTSISSQATASEECINH